MRTQDTNTSRICLNCGTSFHAPPSVRRVNCSQSCYDNVRQNSPPIERFWKRVAIADGCWNWIGVLYHTGYGSFNLGHRHHTAHRWLFEYLNGPVPKGIDVCHSCDNRACVRPSHLWLGTRQENLTDMVTKGRSVRGSDKPSSKLTTVQVLAIRAARETGRSQREVASSFGISQGQVSRITTRQHWTHI